MAATSAYELLISAAAGLKGAEDVDFENPSAEQTRAYLSANAEGLGRACEALGRECRVPLKYERGFFESHCDDIRHLRSLARIFYLESRHARSENDFARATRAGVDLLELAGAARRGGVIVDFLCSSAIAGMALEELRLMRHQLNAARRAPLIKELSRIEDSQEPLSEIVARDRRWEAEVECEKDSAELELPDPEECGLSEEHQRELLEEMRELAALPKNEMHRMWAGFDHRNTALMRMLRVDLVLRSHRAIKGFFPTNLDALAPTFLDAVPADPFTDAPFLYRATEDDFTLYSPGPTQIDHGGRFGSWLSVQAGLADLCLDSADYDPEC